jgi:hypothetical protein
MNFSLNFIFKLSIKLLDEIYLKLIINNLIFI